MFLLKIVLKGIATQMQVLSSFTQVVLNLYEILSTVEYQLRLLNLNLKNFEECW